MANGAHAARAVADVSVDLEPATVRCEEASDVASVSEHALRGDEAARALTFVTVGALFAFLGAASHLAVLLSGIVGSCRLVKELPSLLSLTVFGCVAAFVRHGIRRTSVMSAASVNALAVSAAAFALAFIFYLGPFSPAVVVVVLGFSFFGLSGCGKVSLVYPSVVIASHFGYALLVAADVVRDTGLFSADAAPKPTRWILAFFMMGLCWFAFWQARSNRRATHDAVARATEIARAVRLRDAQLREAHLVLDRLRGRGAGRYSGGVLGSFRLGEIIGRGAMGEVYAASHVETGAPAAVKVLASASVADPSLVARFLREVKITSELRGPNVVAVYESGEAPDGTPFLVMERLVGDDLAAILRREARLDLARTLELVDELASGLDLAHAYGVVHRDLKPQNVFLARRDGGATWTVLDFGVASVTAGGATLTIAGEQVVGTPGYMAPEQARGERGGPRADVFALGAVVYRVLTGEAPFAGNALVALHAVIYEKPTKPSRLVQGLHRDVERVLALALAKAPEQRFASAGDLAEALRRAAAGRLDPRLRLRADLLGAWSA